jgi:3-oxoadipate enol-lactonase
MPASTPLAFEERGTGPALVLVHGHPFGRRMWAPQLASLSNAFRVIAPDLPGYGESPVYGPTIEMRELADTVLELMDALDVQRATVVGLSMGGLVAMELGLAHPERTNGLVLTATTAAPVTPEEAETRLRVAAQLERDGMLGHTLEMGGQLFGPAARRDPELVGRVLAMMLATPPAGAAAALRGRAERPPYDRLLRDLRVPVLVIAGDQDAYSTKEITDQLVESLPRPEVVILPGVGHLPNLEAPEQFDAAVRAFAQERSNWLAT